MLFSVVIPVYNVEKYLEECLASIVPQIVSCEEGAELIIVNDGSTDSSGRICEQYLAKYPDFIRVFHKENEGLLQTRRFGFKQARGEYIINCDSDDFLEQTALRELADIIHKTTPDVVIYDVYMWKCGNKEPFISDVFLAKPFGTVEKKEIINAFLFSSHNIASLWCKCFKRKCLDMEFPYKAYGRLSLGEDTIQTAEIFANAECFVYYNRSLYYYRAGSGMMAKFNKTYYNDSKLVIDHVMEVLKKCELKIPADYYSVKYFSSVGRSITQSRLNKDMSYQQRKDYLSAIREDTVFVCQLPAFDKVNKNIKTSYRLFCKLLIAKQYWLIDLLLRVKNSL